MEGGPRGCRGEGGVYQPQGCRRWSKMMYSSFRVGLRCIPTQRDTERLWFCQLQLCALVVEVKRHFKPIATPSASLATNSDNQDTVSSSHLMVTHARLLPIINLLKNVLLVHGTEKLCSKFGEDRPISDVTVLSTDAGHRTSDIGHRRPDTPRDFIFCPMLLCIALHWTDNNTVSVWRWNHNGWKRNSDRSERSGTVQWSNSSINHITSCHLKDSSIQWLDHTWILLPTA